MARLTSREVLDIMNDAVVRAGREADIRYGFDRHPNPDQMTPEQKVAADIRSVVSCYVQGLFFERRVAMPEMKRMSRKKILSIFRDVAEESYREYANGGAKAARRKRPVKAAGAATVRKKGAE
jgi:hypothetical protein